MSNPQSLHDLLWELNQSKDAIKAHREDITRIERVISEEERKEAELQRKASDLLLATARPERFFHGPMDTMWRYVETSRTFVRLDHLVAYCSDIKQPEAETSTEPVTNHESA